MGFFIELNSTKAECVNKEFKSGCYLERTVSRKSASSASQSSDASPQAVITYRTTILALGFWENLVYRNLHAKQTNKRTQIPKGKK